MLCVGGRKDLPRMPWNRQKIIQHFFPVVTKAMVFGFGIFCLGEAFIPFQPVFVNNDTNETFEVDLFLNSVPFLVTLWESCKATAQEGMEFACLSMLTHRGSWDPALPRAHSAVHQVQNCLMPASSSRIPEAVRQEGDSAQLKCHRASELSETTPGHPATAAGGL